MLQGTDKRAMPSPSWAKQVPGLLLPKVTKALCLAFSPQRRVSICPEGGNQNHTVTDRREPEALQSLRGPRKPVLA